MADGPRGGRAGRRHRRPQLYGHPIQPPSSGPAPAPGVGARIIHPGTVKVKSARVLTAASGFFKDPGFDPGTATFTALRVHYWPGDATPSVSSDADAAAAGTTGS